MELTEARRNSVILIDFQPAYSEPGGEDYESAIKTSIQYINKNRPNVTAFFNGMEVGIEDDVQSVAQHYVEMGLDEDLVYDINFKEKTYAFLRNWMDDVEESIITKFIRYMVINKINDVRNVDIAVFEELFEIEPGEDPDHETAQQMMDDGIYLPDISIGDLKALSGSLLGGGYRSECLSEMQLLMNAFNIKYKLVNPWIYG